MDWATGFKQMFAKTTPLIQRGALMQATEAIQNALGAMTVSALKQQAANQATAFATTAQGMTQAAAQGTAQGSAHKAAPAAAKAQATARKPRSAQAARGLDDSVQDIDFVERSVASSRTSSAERFSEDSALPGAAPGRPFDKPADASAAGQTQTKAQGSFQRIAFSARPGVLQDQYWLYVPAAAATPGHGPLPLVLMLHGCTQNPQDFATGTGMNAEAEAANAFVLYPAQATCANRNSCWNWFRRQDQMRGTGELATLVAMVQEVKARFSVDEDRVYAAGLSAGGAMAALLAREYPELFAAVGVHSGLQAGAAHNVMSALSAMKNGAKLSSQERRAQGHTAAAQPALIVFHGDADATVHARNGEQVIEAALAGDAVDQQVSSGQSAAGQRYTRTVYSRKQTASKGAAEVVAEQWLLHGAGHAWAGGDARGSHTDPRGINASQEMLRFFLAHPRKA